ncbi:MAG: Peptidoglycan-associated lipoprotein [Chlamydiae bacterium]|nr:Peptidoglycan-associated lipoprotein [Chlamydiota bacterium]
MKKFLLLIPLFFLSSCSRSVSQMWDDTKTATSYMGRGFQAFFSGNNEEEQIAMNEDVFQISEDDFIPFDDQDLKAEKTLQATQEPGTGKIPTKSEFFTPPSHLAHIFSNIQFDLNNYQIKGGQNHQVLKQAAQYLKEHPEIYVFVEGHCDERGTAQYNYSLGAKRANTIRNVLVKEGINEGINPNRIFTVSCGKDQPLDPGHSQVSWKKNRRTEFKIYQP